MAVKHNNIKQIKKIINKNKDGISINEISNISGINRNTISKYLGMLHLKGDLDIKESGNLKKYYPAKRVPETVIKNYFHEPCVIINKNMEIEYINEAFLNLTDNTADELTGKKIFNTEICIFYNKELEKNYGAAIEGETVTKNIHTTFCGKKYYILVRLIPIIFEDKRKGFSLIITDKTNFKEKITSGHTNEIRYMNIVEDQTEYIIRLLPDMTITFVNKSFCKYLGRKKDEIIGTKFDPIFSDDKIISLNSIFRSLSIENPSKSITIRTITYEGKINWLEWNIKGIFKNSNELLEYQGIGRNVSKLKSTEEKLNIYKNNLEDLIEKRTIELQNVNKRLYDEILKQRETEKQLDNSLKKINKIKDEINVKNKKIDFILNTANLGMCDINYIDGEIEFNQKCKESLGYSDKEIPKTLENWNKLIHPDDLKELIKIRDEFIKGITPHIHQSEYRVLCKNGNWKWISYTSTTTIRDNRAQLVSATGLIEDISKTKNIENNITALLKLDNQLARTSNESEAHQHCISAISSILGMESAICLEINKNNENMYISYSTNVDEKILHNFPLLKNSLCHEYITDLEDTVTIGHEDYGNPLMKELNNKKIQSATIIPVKKSNDIFIYYLMYSKKEICISKCSIYSIKLIIRYLQNYINDIKLKNNTNFSK